MPHDPPHDPPTEDVLDAPLVGVKLNEQWWSHVIGLASVAARSSYWASDHERGEESMEQLLDLLAKGNLPVFDPLSVRIHRSTVQASPHNATTIISFDTVVWNVGGLFDPAAPTIIDLTEVGLWHIGGGVKWQSQAGGNRFIRPLIGGAINPVITWLPVAAGDEYQEVSTIWRITAPTILRLIVNQGSGITLNVEPWKEHSIDLWANYLGPI